MSFLIPMDFWSVYHVALSGWKVERLWHQVITFPLWSILGFFFVFLNWKHSAYFFSNGTLKSLNGVYILNKGFWVCLLFHPTSKKAFVELRVRMKYGNILALRILLCQTVDPRKKMSYNQIKMCICVENLWWLT